MTVRPAVEHKSAVRIAFDLFLRTGRRIDPQVLAHLSEQKFNPNHDELGRFASAPGGSGAAGLATPPVLPIGKPSATSQSRRAAPPPPPASLPQINGYPEAGKTSWRRANDTVFARVANEYNQRNGLKPGDPRYITPKFMKAWAMVESGGEGSQASFMSDTFQVNKPGDWDDHKKTIGLHYGEKMTPEASARAALLWLDFKRSPKIRLADGTLQVRDLGRQRSLERYNSNSKLDHNGVKRSVTYAARIMSLAR